MLLVPGTYLSAEPVSWDPVEGATEYQLEVSDGRENILESIRTKSPSYDISLPQGNYAIRITAFSVTGEPLGRSRWKKIKVERAVKPELMQSEHGAIVISDAPDKSISLSGKGFTDKTRVFIKQDETVIPLPRVKAKSDEKIVVTIEDALEPGTYDILIMNPGDKEYTWEKGLVVSSHMPRISKVSPARIHDGSLDSVITIEGRHFNPQSTLVLSGPGKHSPVNYIKRTDKTMVATIRGLDKGSYDISLKNPDGTHTEKMSAVVIETYPGFLVRNDVWLAAGYRYSVVLPEWSDLENNSYAGFSLGIGMYPFRMLYRDSLLKGLGISMETWYASYKGKGDFNRSPKDMTQAGVTFCMNYEYFPVSFLSFIFEGGMGLLHTGLEGAGSSKATSSVDMLFTCGAKARVYPAEMFFIETGLGFELLMYTDEKMKNLPFHFRAGLRF